MYSLVSIQSKRSSKPSWRRPKNSYPKNRERPDGSLSAKTDPSILLNDTVIKWGGLSYIASGPLYWYDARFDCTDLWKDHTGNAQIFQRLFGPGGEFTKVDPVAEFPKVRCPVLIACGVFDFAAVPTAWHKFKGLLP